MPYQPDRPTRARSRASNACQRCRKHKIKCTGAPPCTTCEIRGDQCVFTLAEDKITVPASVLRALKSKVQQLESQQQVRGSQNAPAGFSPTDQRRSTLTSSIDPTVTIATSHHSPYRQSPSEDSARNNGRVSTLEEAAPRATRLSNPLVPKNPVYVSDQSGKLMYLGHSSTRSFSRQTLLMINRSSSVDSTIPLSSFVEGDINGDDKIQQALDSVELGGLPSLELALFYLQTVKFRTQPLYYLFDEKDFVDRLNAFYKDVLLYAQSNRLWYIHYLLIMSLGKAMSLQTQTRISPYESTLFDRALRLLPDASIMCRDFVTSTEIHCCAALFLHSLDHRCASHIHMVQALRMAQMQGLHTDMQPSIVGTELFERGRKLWWTVYTLDRRLLSTLGLPNTLHDNDVMSPTPIISNVDLSGTALAIHVRICQQLGRILGTVYSFDGTLNKTFLITAKQVLKGIGGLTDDLADFAARCPGEISRVVAHLNLAYHQCIILTTRPMIFHLLQLRFNSTDPSSSFTILSSTKGLVQACIDSAVKVAYIISQIQEYDLLDTFLPFDLESAFSAAMVLVMASGIHHKLLPEENHLDSLYSAFDYMITKGGVGNNNNDNPASQRKAEIEELSQVMRQADKRVRLGPSQAPQRQHDDSQTSTGHDVYDDAHDHDDDGGGEGDSNNMFGATYPMSLGAGMMEQRQQQQQHLHSPEAMSLPSLPSIGEPFFDEWIMADGLSGAQIMDLADALHVDLFDGGEMGI